MTMIRPVTPDDASAIVDIYNHYVATTTISFEEHPVTPDEMAGRIRDVTAALPWFVYESEGKVAGYAYATKWRARSSSSKVLYSAEPMPLPPCPGAT